MRSTDGGVLWTAAGVGLPVPDFNQPLANRLSLAVAPSDDQVLYAIRWAFEELRLVVEPGGAIGLAAYLADEVERDRPVVVILSGGNVDTAILRRALGDV